jgi:hypothetical protein
MIDNLPIYYAEIIADDDGICCMSLVGFPAVERSFVAFAKQNEPKREVVRFAAIEKDEQRLLLGVIMRADYPIYRNDNGIEYYIVFNAPTIRYMAEKMLVDGHATTVDLQHDGNLVDGVHLQELFIKDSAKGIAPQGFEDVEEGSLFGVYKVHNDEVWDMVKRGECQGFSLVGHFHVSRKDVELQNLMAEVEEMEKTLNNICKND